jgi:gamma-tubulin complex component 2
LFEFVGITFVYLGIEGTYLKPTRLPGKIHISIDDSIDASLKELVNRITPLCQHYSQVVQFAEKNMQLENVGRTNQALAGAIHQVTPI